MGVMLQAFYREGTRGVPSPADGDRSLPWWWDHLTSQAIGAASSEAIPTRRDPRSAHDMSGADSPLGEGARQVVDLYARNASGSRPQHDRAGCTGVAIDPVVFRAGRRAEHDGGIHGRQAP